MDSKTIEGIGIFKRGEGYWEAEPEALQGALLSIEALDITSDIEARAKIVCTTWPRLILQCRDFIEANREKYQFYATQFSGLSVFINTGSEWEIYFDTESDIDTFVGVEFRDDEPFQLIIGD